jgi:sugar O-acyltransferase (sialic acid O-acetyltransferase NeuD family)
VIKARVLVPLVNPNEPEARVVDVLVQDGAAIEAEDAICVLETTKATVEVNAPESGYVRALSVAPGDIVSAETLVCVITSTADEPVELASASKEQEEGATPVGLRITKPALALARELGLDLTALPIGPLVTEAFVSGLAGQQPAEAQEPVSLPKTLAGILIYGGGGHAKAIIDLLRRAGGYRIAGIVDDKLQRDATVAGVPVLGARQALPELAERGIRLAVNAVGALADFASRVEIFEMLSGHGFAFPTIVHPAATVESTAVLEEGVQVFANAYVGSDVVVKFGTIVNTGVILSHDCVIGEYGHVAPGAILAGSVHVGPRSLIGMGVTTAVGVRIGGDVRIGNAAQVNRDMPDRTIVAAGSTWPH